MDAYFLPPEQRQVVPSPVTGKPFRDDNHPSSFDLAALRRDVQAARQTSTVVVEGLLTLWDDALCDMLDWKLFVDCRADERIVRRLRRNMTRGLTFDEIAEVYLGLVRFRHDEFVEPSRWRADLVVNGSLPFDDAVRHIVTLVAARKEQTT